MTIVGKLICVYFDYVILNTIALPFAIYDPVVWAWYTLCIALAFVLRIGMEHKKHRLTWGALLYQSICTISWCFFMILVWNYMFTKDKKGFEIYLFINSLFAVFMVSQFEDIFEIGFKKWIRTKLGKFLASESTEDNQ